ncbi:MAG: Dabb family protein [Bacteroidota bacterium]|nr:Dabb family protein [Bacteroidota bacterium]|tara:strand:+ start:27 stop:332 length:306 start_codon:yes stop_codon:yes gene_type:complete
MLQHIVLWKIKEDFQGVPKSQLIQEFKNKLERLPELISDIDYLQVFVNVEGEGEQVCDLCLFSVHADQKALQQYTEHPEHQKVLLFAKNIVIERRVVDAIS